MFEGMLAKKYILAQKRHSALTVCSIAIALALITMLFSVFSTVMDSLRNIAYDDGAYHVSVRLYSEDEYNAFAEAISDYGTCTLREVFTSHWGNETGIFEVTYHDVDVIFNGYIGTSVELLMDNIGDEIGIDNLYHYQCYKNELLMLCDMVDVQSAVYMVALVALFYAFVLFLIMMLRLIIDTAFEISSKERERQFGVLQSIGATPKQIVRIITYEGLTLSVIGIPLGVGLGIGLGYAVYRAVLGTGLADLYLSQAKAAELVHFSVNPWFLLLGVVTGAAWVLFSAYGTGMRVIKMSPVQAISQRSNTVKKVRRFSLFGKVFGWTGKVASRNNMRQPKRFIATVVSLTLSIALFSAVTVVVDNLQVAAEEYYVGINYYKSDFDIDYAIDEEEPFRYRNYVKPLEESGLFENMIYSQSEFGRLPDDERYAFSTPASVNYYSRAAYDHLFNGDPPVSYDELTESGGYLLDGRMAAEGSTPDSITIVYTGYITRLTEEEYNALSPEEQEKCYYTPYSLDGGITWIPEYEYILRYSVDLDVYHINDPITDEYASCMLIGTIDQYENGAYSLFSGNISNGNTGSIYFNLINDDDYYKAVDFLEQSFDGYSDNFYELRQMRAMLASVNIIATFFSILIALIAVVNMVNIIATGILNRRGELAAMQCVGMTEKQLYKMTAVECLQYALISGIAAIGVCELLMFLTEKLLYVVLEIMEFLGDFISYVQPLPIIGIASLCAFIVAIAASIIPLRAMRRTSLVEQIRSVE